MKEKISALMDGELDGPEMHEAIRRMRGDAGKQRCWEDFHLIGDALRKNLPLHFDPEFSSRISQTISQEDIPATPIQIDQPSSHHNNIKRPLAGFAMAASVAAVAYLGFAMIALDDPSAPRLASNAPTAPLSSSVATFSPTVPVQGLQTVQGSRWNVAQPAIESKLNTYLYSHRNISSAVSMNGRFLPHTRIIVAKPNQGE